MSLARKNAKDAREYREGYLQSDAWQRRRKAFYSWVARNNKVAVCVVCGTLADLHLHHLSYRGVRFDSSTGEWVSQETNDEFLVLCAKHHSQLHRYFDTHVRELSGRDNRKWASLRWVNEQRRQRAMYARKAKRR